MATALCVALFSTAAIAANPTLQTIDVTPTAKTISVGQKQSFAATGTFSNGSKQALGAGVCQHGTGFVSHCVH